MDCNDPLHRCELACPTPGVDDARPAWAVEFANTLKRLETLLEINHRADMENLRRWRLFCDAISAHAAGFPRFLSRTLIWDGSALTLHGRHARASIPIDPEFVRRCVVDGTALLEYIIGQRKLISDSGAALAAALPGDPTPF